MNIRCIVLHVAIRLIVLLACASPVCADAKKIPILLDTDIGSDIDDTFAVGLVLASPELDVQAVTTVGAQAADRAWIVCRFLTHSGIKGPVVAYGRGKQPDYGIDWQIQYRRHPAPLFNRTQKPVKAPAVEVMYNKLKAQPGKVTLIAVGPLTNVARLFKDHPDAVKLVKRVVIMGGALKVGYNGKPPAVAEWNFKQDPAAAQAVLASGSKITLVPLDVCLKARLEKKDLQRIFSAHTRLTFQVQNLYELWDKEVPILFDPLAVAQVLPDFGKFTTKAMQLKVDDKGKLHIAKNGSHVQVVTGVDHKDFLARVIQRLRNTGPAVLPKEPPNPSKLIANDRFPNRVHCFEDYETDIEKRWWMCGKVETKNVPPGSKRACRGVLTQDFDDRMGNMKTSYRAVIFNPVPGPPMGKNPRLRFRYWLKGTDTLRVQIYSLSKGYHRCLTLKGLPQGTWQLATVDMTQVRKPDGSGGPLSENERIDDVQFYVDPRAELLIDDMVLYDAPAKGKKRPFPQKLQYTGWFDTGRQGKEWPGDFAFDKNGYFRRAAKSVPRKDGTHWIRLQVRGKRPLGEKTRLFFRYKLTGTDSMRVVLVTQGVKKRQTVVLKKQRTNEWAEATVAFPPNREGNAVQEIQFLLPRKGMLLLDDVLLYTQGK